MYKKTALNTIIDQFPTTIQACIMSIKFLKGQCQKTNIFGYFLFLVWIWRNYWNLKLENNDSQVCNLFPKNVCYPLQGVRYEMCDTKYPQKNIL